METQKEAFQGDGGWFEGQTLVIQDMFVWFEAWRRDCVKGFYLKSFQIIRFVISLRSKSHHNGIPLHRIYFKSWTTSEWQERMKESMSYFFFHHPTHLNFHSLYLSFSLVCSMNCLERWNSKPLTLCFPAYSRCMFTFTFILSSTFPAHSMERKINIELASNFLSSADNTMKINSLI